MADPARPSPLGVQSREAARRLGMSERTLWSLTKADRIRCVRLGTGPKARKLYPIAELERFLAGPDAGQS